MSIKNEILRVIICSVISSISSVAMGSTKLMTSQANNGPDGIFNNNTGSGNQYNLSIKYLGNYQNNVQSIGMQVNSYHFSPPPAPREKNRDRLSLYQERYLIATNPTELSVSNVEMAYWVGDAEPFLTVTVENPSNIPAEKLNISLVKPASANGASETIKFRPSEALIQGKVLKAIKSGLFLPQKKSLRLPLGSKTQLLENVVDHIPQGYTFFGVGDKPNIPDGLCDKTHGSSATEADYSMHVTEARTAAFAIALKYDTIFDQHLVRLFPLYLYFGRCYSQANELTSKHQTLLQK